MTANSMILKTRGKDISGLQEELTVFPTWANFFVFVILTVFN